MSIKKVDVFQVDIEEEVNTKKRGLELQYECLLVVVDYNKSPDERKELICSAVDEYFKKFRRRVKVYRVKGSNILESGIFIRKVKG